MPTVRHPPITGHLPAPIFFRADELPAQTLYPEHSHAWGEFVYAYTGVMEIRLADRQFLAPPQLGVWLPPAVRHQSLNRLAASHCSLYVSLPFAAAMPADPCSLTVNRVARAILDELRLNAVEASSQPVRNGARERLLEVLVDQLCTAPRQGSYLPGSSDALLAPVLHALQAHPGDNRPLADWARTVHTTERTLLRRFQQELGMPFVEWRQRLRVVNALPRLHAGEKVESIALDLGYASASAFICMFRKRVGTTPDAFRAGDMNPHKPIRSIRQ